MTEIRPIPEGYHTITAALVIKGAEKAVEFYKKAFGAREVSTMKSPEGKIVHSELKIGDSMLMLTDEFPWGGCKSPESLGGCTHMMYLYVENVDQLFRQAIAAGAREQMAVRNEFWGDRHGSVVDPFGIHWSIATHVEDVPEKELEKRSREFFEKSKTPVKS